ncbi:Spy/CpxP family protein refolding chaperone [Burkholderiaceae bacterium UC74_6]
MELSRILKTGAATLAIALGAAAAQAQPPMDHGRMPPAGEMGMMHERMFHDLKAVDATDAQKQQLHAIFKQAMDDNKAASEQLRKLHEQIGGLLAAPVVDANSVTSLSQQAQTQHDAIATRMTRALIDAANVLTPEQRAKLQALHKKQAEHMKERFKERAARKGAAASAPQ